MSTRQVIRRPNGDACVALTAQEFQARCTALRLDWCDSDGIRYETEDATVQSAEAKWQSKDYREPADLRFDLGVWSALNVESAHVARYVQELWDATPREGDEAEFLAELLVVSERNDALRERWRDMEMADAVARRLGIPDTRSHDLLGNWDFWESGVSLRTGWFATEAAARAHLHALLEEQATGRK